MRSPRLFNLGARGYDFITNQGIWARHIEHSLLHAKGMAPPRRVLDLGCGPGLSAAVLARQLPRARVIGIDLAEQMIARAKRHQRGRDADLSNLSFEVADAAQLRFPDDHFDLALGHSFLYLVSDPAAVLRETRRVLRPGGSVVFLEPNRAGALRSALRALPGHAWQAARHPWQSGRFALSVVLWRAVSASVGRLSDEQLRGLLAEAGFEQVDVTSSLAGLGLLCRGRVPS